MEQTARVADMERPAESPATAGRDRATGQATGQATRFELRFNPELAPGPTGPPIPCAACGSPQTGTILVYAVTGPARVRCWPCLEAQVGDHEGDPLPLRQQNARLRGIFVRDCQDSPPCGGCGRWRRSWRDGRELDRACSPECERRIRRESRRRARVLTCELEGCERDLTAKRAGARFCSPAHRKAHRRAVERG